MYLTNTELRVFKVISQRKRIGRGGGRGRRDGFNEQFRGSMTSCCSLVRLLSVRQGRGESKAAPRRSGPGPASCCTLLPSVRNHWSGRLCLLSTPTEQGFHSLLEKDAAVYRASQPWLSLSCSGFW